MNERIRELAVEAGMDWKEQPPHYTNTNNPVAFPMSVNRNLEKFSELIIEECIKACQSRVGNSDYNTGRMHCVSDIKEHFGVKQ